MRLFLAATNATLSRKLGPVLAEGVLPVRLVPVAVALKPLLEQMRRKGDVLFLSWLGPLGAAALYYVALSLQEVEA